MNQNVKDFYKEYKKLFFDNNDYDNIELFQEIGELTIQHKLSKDDVKIILSGVDTSFDYSRFLQSTLDHWDDENNKNNKIPTKDVKQIAYEAALWAIDINKISDLKKKLGEVSDLEFKEKFDKWIEDRIQMVIDRLDDE